MSLSIRFESSTSVSWAGTADGAGVIHLPCLEAGVHKLRLRGASQEHFLEVPALSAAAKPIEVRLVLE